MGVLVALEAEHTGRRSVGQRSAPGGLLAAAVPGASPTARSTGQHSSPAAFGERPSPGNKLAERRRNSTATMKELVPTVADKVFVASTSEFHDPVEFGAPSPSSRRHDTAEFGFVT